MKKLLLLLLPLSMLGTSVSMGQKVGLKNNLIYDALYLTPNLGLEIKLGKRTTLELAGGYNWFNNPYGSEGKFKHFLVQPEFRIWTCESFNGTFFGIHAHGGLYNIGGMKLPFGAFPSLKENRYEGHYYGAGISVGHQWIIGKRWGIEATIGGGWTHVEYDKYNYETCSEINKTGKKDFFGLTKAGLSFIFFFK